jgi:hypothetical protein
LRVIRPRGISIATAKASVNAGDIEGPIDKSLGTKEALAVRLRKLAIDGEKTFQGVQTLRTSRASRCRAFSVEHRLDRTARTYLSFIGAPAFIGAPESDRLP